MGPKGEMEKVFQLAKKNANNRNYNPVTMIYDAPKDWPARRVAMNKDLAAHNLKAVEIGTRTIRLRVVPKNYRKPVPLRWCSFADEIVMVKYEGGA